MELKILKFVYDCLRNMKIIDTKYIEKMELKILKLIYDYSINMKIIDKKYIEKLVEIVTTSKSLNSYVRNILWLKELKERGNGINMGSYNLMNKNLEVNLAFLEWLFEHHLRYDYLFSDIEQIFYRNLIFTQVILHELEHANQNKMVDLKGDDLETKLLSANFMIEQTLKNPKFRELIDKGYISVVNLIVYIEEQKALYYLFYEQSPSERLAEIKSLRIINNILEIIKKYVPNLSQIEKASLIEQMLRGYSPGRDSVESPTQIYLMGTGQQNIMLLTEFDWFDFDEKIMLEKVSEKYDLKKRLTYGLPVNKAEYCQTKKWLQSTNKFM